MYGYTQYIYINAKTHGFIPLKIFKVSGSYCVAVSIAFMGGYMHASCNNIFVVIMWYNFSLLWIAFAQRIYGTDDIFFAWKYFLDDVGELLYQGVS